LPVGSPIVKFPFKCEINAIEAYRLSLNISILSIFQIFEKLEPFITRLSIRIAYIKQHPTYP